jgi:hypothetical protein
MKRRRSHIFAKDKHEHYVEPAWVSRRLFQVEKFTSLVYDPACGWGTILKEARAAGYKVYGTDIINRRRHRLPTFRKYDFLARCDAIAGSSVVCNPPFDHVQEFCQHALELGAPKVAMIMLLRRLPAAHWLQKLPLRRTYFLCPRPSMPPGNWIAAGNKPGGGTQDFVWAIFERGYTGKPELAWLHRDETMVE